LAQTNTKTAATVYESAKDLCVLCFRRFLCWFLDSPKAEHTQVSSLKVADLDFVFPNLL